MYVIERPHVCCGARGIPEVLRGEAELPQGYHILYSFRVVYVACPTVDCLPLITGRAWLAQHPRVTPQWFSQLTEQSHKKCGVLSYNPSN